MGLTIKGGQEPRRNEPCPCGSGLKYKYCHGDSIKTMICNRVANEKMVFLIRDEKIKIKGLFYRKQYPRSITSLWNTC